MIPFLLTLFISFLGMSCLALGLPRHHRRFWAVPAPDAHLKRSRRLGWTLLAASALPCLLEWTAAISLVVWIGVQTLALLSVAWMLAATPPDNPG